ncbi:MAG TPA: alpha-amylase family glycosyl hydrolase [Kofleriaceae bacterium]|nr:alpha-amylase family glycosyl hydrolase [Kofleriaceae bacterium]
MFAARPSLALLLLLLTACPGGSSLRPGDFCDDVFCGAGTCDEAAEACDCNDGYQYDLDALTCVSLGELCADVVCDGEQICDPGTGQCGDTCTPDRTSGDFAFCALTSTDGYAVVVTYTGAGRVDVDATEIRLNGAAIDPAASFDAETQTFALRATGLTPSKYSYLFRLKTDGGVDVRPLFVPMWIGEGMRYADFTWMDSILYQIFTDRFSNGSNANDLDNSQGDLARVTDSRSHWQGGDFAGIIAKLREGYFEAMGINTLWISSPLLNSHNSQPSVQLDDDRRFSSYHAYHPVVTGYTHLDDYGYANPIEPAFGTPAELHELVNEAHRRGIRVVPDFVANHTHIEAAMYQRHPEWFFSYAPCDGRWDEGRIDCWFTTDMPDLNFGGHPAAITAVVDHAIWLIQEFNFDGFRADALKHMDDGLVRALKTAVVEQIETTVDDHSRAMEPTVFYMVGESLGGWARYHVREDMVQGQVDEEYYNRVKGSLLTFTDSVRNLAGFALYNDTAYLSPEPTMGGSGGYPGAIMGNFFGNHDQWRALTEAGGSYERLRLAQTFLMTSPGNIPMLYQGDDIGTLGEQDPDNRKMQRFTGLTTQEQTSLANVRKAGLLREAHPALRRGVRTTEVLEDWFWIYKVVHGDDVVYVAINRDDDKSWTPPAGYVDGLGNCSGGVVPILSSCIFVKP